MPTFAQGERRTTFKASAGVHSAEGLCFQKSSPRAIGKIPRTRITIGSIIWNATAGDLSLLRRNRMGFLGSPIVSSKLQKTKHTLQAHSMPELPDIAAYITALEPRIVAQPIERIRVASPFLLRTAQPPLSNAEGRVVRELRRVGKRIAIGVDN